MGEQEKSSSDEKEKAENHYQLDLDAHSSDHLDSVIEDAVAAVRRDKKPGSSSEQEEEDVTPVPDVVPVLEVVRESDDEVAKLRVERDRLRDGLQRTLADLDNYRKRTEREKKSLSRFAVSEVIRDFLGVIDNLERAMAASGSADDLKKGLEMVLRQQGDILGRHGVEEIEAVGKEFDPAVHEAVMRQESDEISTPMVSAELQKGYMHYDRLLRPAMVHVTMPSKPTTSTGDGVADDGMSSGSKADAKEEAAN